MKMIPAEHGGDNKEAPTAEDTVDFRGNPADRSKTGGWLGAGLILGTELSERVCVIGILMNLVTYLTGDMHLRASKSATIVTNFMGTLNLLALLGGFLADAKLGRYLTVAIFSSVMALGTVLLTLATSISSMRPPHCEFRKHPQDCTVANPKQLALLYAALYTIALGGGGLKANVSGFGSDQFDVTDPKEEKAMIFFFNRFYLCISMGSLFATTVLVYVQDNIGRGWGYGISAAATTIAVLVFLCGTKYYRYRKPRGSPLTVISRVFFLAWKKRKLQYPSTNPSELNDYHSARVPHTESFKCLDKAAIIDEYASKEENRNNPWIVSSVTEVEEVKMVVKLFPIWATSIMFWTIYSQMTTFSIEQGTYMNRKIGSFVVPSGSMSFFLIGSIILFTSLNERLFVPMARKLTHNAQGITSLQRVGIGLLFSVTAMVAAAIVEKQRREMRLQHGTRISAFWLVPQFFLVGAGEAFAYVGQLEFFIIEAPERMKSMSTGLFLTTLAMGFFFSSFLVSVVERVTKNSWLKSNMNMAKLDYFYWLLAVLGVLNYMVFLAFAKKHQYKVQPNVINDGGAKELEKWNDV